MRRIRQTFEGIRHPASRLTGCSLLSSVVVGAVLLAETTKRRDGNSRIHSMGQGPKQRISAALRGRRDSMGRQESIAVRLSGSGERSWGPN